MRFGLLFVLLMATNVVAKTDIVMVFGGEYPPYYNETQSAGMFIEFLKAFNEENPDFTIQFVPLSRRRIDVWIENGKADAFSLAHEAFVPESVRAQFAATDVIWETSDRIVSSTDSPIVFDDILQLEGRRIGTLIGNGYMDLEALFNAGISERVDFYTIKGQFDAVLAKKIDAMVINEHSILHYVDLLGYDKSKIFVNQKPAYTFGLSTMVRRNRVDFLRALNRYIRKSRQDGSLDQISQRYKFEPIQPAFSANTQ